VKTPESGCNTDSENHTQEVVSNVPINMKRYLKVRICTRLS